MKNIIFLTDNHKSSSGGKKIIYQYSKYINSLNSFSSSVLHLEKKKIYKYILSLKKFLFKNNNLKFGWNLNELKISKKLNYLAKKNNIILKKDFIFNKKNDHIIIPEVFSHLSFDLCFKKNIRYSIFVQNSYAIESFYDFDLIYKSYQRADNIISCSRHITNSLKFIFPDLQNKIIEVVNGIDSQKLIFTKKQNLITYMPRKLAKHGELVLFFLKKHLPKNWSIKAIYNLPENEVFRLLKKSKIFLSFSELEGLGLPPIEAALAGNIVIGYTGNGGVEYWKKPIFLKINNGEIENFAKEVLKNLNNHKFINSTINHRKLLSLKYSLNKQNYFLDKFLKKVRF